MFFEYGPFWLPSYLTLRQVPTSTQAALLYTPWNDLSKTMKREKRHREFVPVSLRQRFRSVFDSIPHIAAGLGQNMNIIAPSESQGEIVHPNVSSTSEDEEPVLETIPDSSSDVRPELSPNSLVAGSEIYPVDEQSTSNCDSLSDDVDRYVRRYTDRSGITISLFTISAFTETGQAEASIKVPKQQFHTGLRPVIPSSLADTPCAALGVQGVLDRLNATLGTSHTLNTPSVLSLLEECIEKNYDFGTVYGRLRRVWSRGNNNMEDELRRHEEGDRKMRQRVLVGNRIVNPNVGPRPCVVYPISHAWVDEEDRVDALTPINGKEWPVPIPKDANLNLIRIEMLNLKAEYTWLDILCLRQKDGLREDLRADEWKLDVPTIGYIYRSFSVVIYLSGLGRPLSLKEGDLDSDRSWFRRAWTVQEVGMDGRTIAGDTPDGPMHAEPIDDDGNYETDVLTRFHKQLKSLHTTQDIFNLLTAMRDRVSTNPVDRVAGLALPLWPDTIPAYYESGSLEDAWVALVNTTHEYNRGILLFQYPGVGLGCKKWRPTWDQVM
ncbi:hypothetical protein EV421DRAFT_2063400, partial [Armillaria borealis]